MLRAWNAGAFFLALRWNDGAFAWDVIMPMAII